jgi:hypothetical protein
VSHDRIDWEDREFLLSLGFRFPPKPSYADTRALKATRRASYSLPAVRMKEGLKDFAKWKLLQQQQQQGGGGEMLLELPPQDVAPLKQALVAMRAATPAVGRRVTVRFSDGSFYAGTITRSKQVEASKGQKRWAIDIAYDDGDVESTCYPCEGVHLLGDGNEEKKVGEQTNKGHGGSSSSGGAGRSSRVQEWWMFADEASRAAGAPEPFVGTRVEVEFRDVTGSCWYDGEVAKYDPQTKTHTVRFDDGEVRAFDMEAQSWKKLPGGYSSKLEKKRALF